MFLSGPPSRKRRRTDEQLRDLQQQTVAAVDVQKQLLELKKAEIEMQREMLMMQNAKMACNEMSELLDLTELSHCQCWRLCSVNGDRLNRSTACQYGRAGSTTMFSRRLTL